MVTKKIVTFSRSLKSRFQFALVSLKFSMGPFCCVFLLKEFVFKEPCCRCGRYRTLGNRCRSTRITGQYTSADKSSSASPDRAFIKLKMQRNQPGATDTLTFNTIQYNFRGVID